LVDFDSVYVDWENNSQRGKAQSSVSTDIRVRRGVRVNQRWIDKYKGADAMGTYRATVRVRSTIGNGTMVVWAQTCASNPIDAAQLLEAQYGRGSVISIPVLVK
jgi:hypothetical protein